MHDIHDIRIRHLIQIKVRNKEFSTNNNKFFILIKMSPIYNLHVL